MAGFCSAVDKEAFSLFLTDGRVAIDTHPAERALHLIGIGEEIGCSRALTLVSKPWRAL